MTPVSPAPRMSSSVINNKTQHPASQKNAFPTPFFSPQSNVQLKDIEHLKFGMFKKKKSTKKDNSDENENNNTFSSSSSITHTHTNNLGSIGNSGGNITNTNYSILSNNQISVNMFSVFAALTLTQYAGTITSWIAEKSVEIPSAVQQYGGAALQGLASALTTGAGWAWTGVKSAWDYYKNNK